MNVLPELAALESGRHLIRVPDQLNVPLTPRVQALIDTAAFQRLGRISQLGLVAKVYPGAKHTRFEHALGVYFNALRYLQQLLGDERFQRQIDEKSASQLIAAALLHDVGHWPFCHPIEDMALEGLPPHEEHAARFLNDAEVATVLAEHWGLSPEDLLDVLTTRRSTPTLRLLRSVLSGPIDIDKMDYLDRDSLHCGVPYGRNFDKQRLIQSLVLNEQGDGLAITSKGKTAAELMVFARYVMFSEVYWHHAVRSATSMFARGFFEIYESVDLHALFGQDEMTMTASLQRVAEGTAAKGLFDGIFGARRLLYKRVLEYSHDQHPQMYDLFARRPYAFLVDVAAELARGLSSLLDEPLDECDLLIDGPPPEREVEFRIDIQNPKTGEYKSLHEMSPVVDALALRQFDDYVKRVRLFAHPRVAGRLRELTDLDERVIRAVESVQTGD